MSKPMLVAPVPHECYWCSKPCGEAFCGGACRYAFKFAPSSERIARIMASNVPSYETKH